MAKVEENSFTLAANEPRARGNVINTGGVRMGMGSPVSIMNVRTTDTVSSAYSSRITTPSSGGQVTNSVPRAYPFLCTIFESLAIPPLSGKGFRSRQTFTDWIEQFELIASVCHWDDQAKLVNLTTRLRGRKDKHLLFISHVHVALNSGIIIQFL